MLRMFYLRNIFNSTAILALLIFITEFQHSLSKKQKFSDQLLNNEIRRSVNDGFTVTKEDKDYFETMIKSVQLNNSETNEHKEDPRIVQGRAANLGELPYQCALQLVPTGFSYCGAALIDPLGKGIPQYVITAEHCVKDKTRDLIQVVCGVLKMSQTKDLNTFRIKRIHHHPYNDATKVGDLAIIELEHNNAVLRNDISLNRMKPIAIPDVTLFNKFAGKECTVSGWGRQVSNGANKPDDLLEAGVLVPTQEKCAQMFEDHTDIFNRDFMMCAGGADRDACQGDSGGPLRCVVDGKSYLAGIVSFGIGCATEGVPGGYTNVAKYHDWIVETVRSAEEPPILFWKWIPGLSLSKSQYSPFFRTQSYQGLMNYWNVETVREVEQVPVQELDNQNQVTPMGPSKSHG